jgi:hypothetical protein
MKYQDNAAKTVINGFQVGIKLGSPIRDGQAPADDGYDHLRNNTEHVGTVLQDGDAAAVNPTPAV